MDDNGRADVFLFFFFSMNNKHLLNDFLSRFLSKRAPAIPTENYDKKEGEGADNFCHLPC